VTQKLGKSSWESVATVAYSCQFMPPELHPTFQQSIRELLMMAAAVLFLYNNSTRSIYKQLLEVTFFSSLSVPEGRGVYPPNDAYCILFSSLFPQN